MTKAGLQFLVAFIWKGAKGVCRQTDKLQSWCLSGRVRKAQDQKR